MKRCIKIAVRNDLCQIGPAHNKKIKKEALHAPIIKGFMCLGKILHDWI
ncbi:MAG: hypothetical protein ACI8XU_002576 [Kiritimatiellia bacterium]|jgi:hypothetical protein